MSFLIPRSYRDAMLVAVVVAVMLTIVYFDADGKSLIKWIVQAVVAMGVLTFIYRVVSSYISSIRTQIASKPEAEKDIEESEELKSRQRTSRNKIQDAHEERAESYKERILLPREEAKRQRREEEISRFSGPAWKGKGQELGGEVTDVRQRRLPEPPVTEQTIQPKKETIKKEPITLPDEPSADLPGTVLVILRTPQGKFCRRRFLQTHRVKVMFDFMATVGYSQKHYDLYSSYPRESLMPSIDKTMLDMNIGKQITLNVEENEVD